MLVLLCLTLSIHEISSAQTFTRCDVYQFEGVDSTNKKIVLTETYNSRGLLIYQTYSDYKETYLTSMSDASYSYFYQDTLLTQMASLNMQWGDSSKSLYFYNEKHQQIKYQYYSFEKRLKENIDKGLGSTGGCLVTEEDYEKERTWELTDESIFEYDAKKRTISELATLKSSYSMSDKSTWEYDSLDRVVKCFDFRDEQLSTLKEYTYFERGFKIKTTSYDSEGKAEHLKQENDGYYPQYEDTYFLNNKGYIVKEISKTEKGEIRYTELTFYNIYGKIERNVY